MFMTDDMIKRTKKTLDRQVSHIELTEHFLTAFCKWWRTQQEENCKSIVKKITDNEIKNAVKREFKTHAAIILLENHKDNWGMHFSVWRSQILLFHKTFYKGVINEKTNSRHSDA